MNQHIDELLRDKMKGASIDELMESYDEEAIWQQINKKNRPLLKAKNLYGMQYWRYAAILILGLLLGFYFDKNKETEVLTEQRISAGKAHMDTVFINTPMPKITPMTSSFPTKKTNQIRVIKSMHKKSRDNNEMPLVQETRTEIRQEEKAIVLALKKEIRVVYFEDIQMEDKALATISEKKSRRKLLQVNMPQSKEATSQELPLRSFVYALNQ